MSPTYNYILYIFIYFGFWMTFYFFPFSRHNFMLNFECFPNAFTKALRSLNLWRKDIPEVGWLWSDILECQPKPVNNKALQPPLHWTDAKVAGKHYIFGNFLGYKTKSAWNSYSNITNRQQWFHPSLCYVFELVHIKQCYSLLKLWVTEITYLWL